MTRLSILALVVVVACGQDRQERIAQPTIPPRVRLLTDAQFANAVRDLLGVDAPAIHTPGTAPHQLVHEEVMAIDGARLVEYRLAAETVAKLVAAAPPCSELPCTLDFTERAFRRPLDIDEHGRIAAMFAQGGFALVVEAVLQAPSFLYRTQLGGDAAQTIELTPHELAAELAFLLYDSLPDRELRAAAADGSLADPEMVEQHVDRLLAEPRVQDHVVRVVLDWLQIHRVLEVDKNLAMYPELTPDLRASMYAETERFVRDVLENRNGSLRELLTSRRSFVDGRLAAIYELPVAGDDFVAVDHDARQRGGILTHASLMTALASAHRPSIILRGKYVHDTLLCTPEPGRPPFDAIAQVGPFTDRLSESQAAHYRAAHNYCSQCHRVIDPPGRALERYDAIGRWRFRDELGIAVEDDTRIEIDGVMHDVRGALELGELIADSDQVARCATSLFAQHAFGRHLDAKNLDLLVDRFEASERNLVELFRVIATSRAFRLRRWEAP